MEANSQCINISRFKQPMYIKTNEIVTHSIQVRGQILYYQPYSEDTVSVLTNQYRKFTKDSMKLQLDDLSLPSYAKLKHFALKDGGEQLLETFLNACQKPYHLSMQQISHQIRSKFKDLFSTIEPIIVTRNEVTRDEVTRDEVTRNEVKKYKVINYWRKIRIINCPNSQKQITFQLDLNYYQTISDIIKQGCRRINYDFKEMVECCDENMNEINPNDYNKKITDLWETIPQQIILTIISNNCYYYHNSTLCIKDMNKPQKLEIKDLSFIHSQHSKNNKIEAMTYYLHGRYFQTSSIQQIQQSKSVNQYCQIHASKRGSWLTHIQTHLKCSPYSMFLNDDHTWIQARHLNIGDSILGIDYDNKLSQFKITKILTIRKGDSKNKSNNQIQKFYSISCPQNRNIILNNLIVHNKNSIELEVHYMNEGHKQIKKKNVYKSNKIKDIFSSKRCQIAGTKLNNSLTFGDYFISDKMIIQVYQKSLTGLKQVNYVNQILFFQKEESTYNLTALDEKTLAELKLKWSQDYLGISQKQIFPLFNRFYETLSTTKIKHILLCIKDSLQPINYFQNIRQRYRSQQQKQYLYYRQTIEKQLFLQKSKRSLYTAVRLYTGDTIYGDLNKFLYKQYGKLGWQKNNEKMIGLIGWLYQEFAMQENFQDNGKFNAITYRGMRNINLKQYFGLNDVKKNETIVLSNFTSTSKNIHTAASFSNEAGAILTFICKSGKNIEKYSKYSNEEEILILPWSHFIIKQYNLQSSPQTATLEQIPLPKLNTNKIIFWVDDNPIQNRPITSNYFSKRGIQVVEILTTNMMQLIIKKYFWLYRLLGKKIVIISDMARTQDGKMNENAGAELAAIVLNQYGISYPLILYVRQKEITIQKLKKNGVSLQEEHIATYQYQLFELVINILSQ